MNANPNAAPLRGKVTRLPLAIREMVCEKLLEGWPARKILPWLNALPGVGEFLASEYAGEPVNDQNLSAFRQGYYQKWLASRERVERTKQLAATAAAHSRADGGSIAAGTSSVLAGKLLEIMEEVDDLAESETGHKIDPESLVKIASALAAIRSGDQQDVKLAHEQRKLNQKDEEIELDRARFQRDTCELFLKWHAEKTALDVANGEGSNADKIEKLGQLMFGETWKPQAAAGKL